MPVTTSNLAMGPATLYVGMFNASEPADTAVSSAPASASWVDVGGTLGGVTLTISQEYKSMEVDQITMPVGARRTSLGVQLKTKIGEVTKENLVIAVNGATGDISSGSGYSKYTPSLDDSSAEPNYRAFILDGLGPNGKRRRVIVRKVLATDALELESSKDGQQGFPLTLTAYYVSAAIAPYVVIDQV